MRRKMKKISCIIITIAIIISNNNFYSVFAAEESPMTGICGDNITWHLQDGVLTLNGSGNMYDYSSNSQDKLTPWYNNRSQINSVVVNDGITGIGEYAFWNCSNLIEASLPNTVTKLGLAAFQECKSLKIVNLPDDLTIIDARVFYLCDNLLEIIIPSGVTEIKSQAFSNCYNLKNVQLPNTLTKIGSQAFLGCQSITKMTIPSTVTEIGESALFGCKEIEEIEFPKNVTTFGSQVLGHCNKLKKVMLPTNITSIPRGTFKNCFLLESIAIPKSVTIFGEDSFLGVNNIKNIFFEGSLDEWSSIGFSSSCISYTDYTKLYFNCDLSSVRILDAEGVDTNPKNGKCGDNIVWNLNNGVLTISGSGKMYDYSPAVRLNPIDVAYKGMFKPSPWFNVRSSINTVVVEDGILEIGAYSFYNCANLSTVSLPTSVKKIDEGAFEKCTKLKSINLPTQITEIGIRVFYCCTGLTKLELPVGITEIKAQGLGYCSKLAYIELPETLTHIGEEAFFGCSAITELTVPESVRLIERSAFAFCENLEKISLPSYCSIVGGNTFLDCYKLKQIVLPKNITSIPRRMFEECKVLESITIPKSVTRFEEDSFYRVYTLKDIYYEGSQTDWDSISKTSACLSLYSDTTIHYNYSKNVFEGTGTLSNPYKIHTYDEFQRISDYPEAVYELCEDIDMLSNNGAWKPIREFRGTLIGNNHKIYNIKSFEHITGHNMFSPPMGLFFELKNAKIEGLSVSLYSENDYSVSDDVQGGLIATQATNSSISKCIASGNININKGCYAAGILGLATACDIDQCMFKGNISLTSGATYVTRVAGILCEGTGTCNITNCFVDASLYNKNMNAFHDDASVGGIVGGVTDYNKTTIKNCLSLAIIDNDEAGRYEFNETGAICGQCHLGQAMGDPIFVNSYYNSSIQIHDKFYYTDGEKTEEDLKKRETFIDWEFENIWIINPKKNQGFPYLKVAEVLGFTPTDTEPETMKLVDENGNILQSDSPEYKKLEHLAFAKLIYHTTQNGKGKTVTEYVKESKKSIFSEPIWKQNDAITLRRFEEDFVGDWEIIEYENKNSDNGFVAAAFKKGDNIIISYCGSEGLSLGITDDGELTAGKDWDTDIRFALTNELSNQFVDADLFYKKVKADNPTCNITFTGHSLGGALAGYESIITGKTSFTFDSAVGHITDLTYLSKWLDIASVFTGIDKTPATNYTDISSVYTIADIIQHTNTESYNLIENYISPDMVYEDNGLFGSEYMPRSAYSHKIFTSLRIVDDNTIKFTECRPANTPSRVYSQDIADMSFLNKFNGDFNIITDYCAKLVEFIHNPIKFLKSGKGRVMVGTSGDDVIVAPCLTLIDDLMLKTNSIIYGGNGNDVLRGYAGDDVLVAGSRGKKELDGMYGNDTYVITPGSNTLYIYDSFGANLLLFEGYEDLHMSDLIFENKNKMYIEKYNQTIYFNPLLFSESDLSITIRHSNNMQEIGKWSDLSSPSPRARMRIESLSLIEEVDEPSFIQCFEIDGVATVKIYDAKNQLIDTISNNEVSNSRERKDYGNVYLINDNTSKRIIAHVMNGYYAEIEGSEMINAAYFTSDGKTTGEAVIRENISASDPFTIYYDGGKLNAVTASDKGENPSNDKTESGEEINNDNYSQANNNNNKEGSSLNNQADSNSPEANIIIPSANTVNNNGADVGGADKDTGIVDMQNSEKEIKTNNDGEVEKIQEDNSSLTLFLVIGVSAIGILAGVGIIIRKRGKIIK